MLEDFKKALARVQSDYGFYIGCQTNPALALAGYDLSRGRAVGVQRPRDARRHAEARDRRSRNLRPITVKISGKHDWINRAVPVNLEMAAIEKADRDAKVARRGRGDQAGAGTDDERTGATVGLMELIG